MRPAPNTSRLASSTAPRSALWIALVAALLLAPVTHARQAEKAAPAPALSVDQQLEFLKSAKITGSRQIGKGITGALRLTLTDGKTTHDASFQRVDQKSTPSEIAGGKRRAGELRFVDAYRYNIAAWELSRLLGLEHMMPATIERRHNGEYGALSWWIDDVMMDEAERETTNTQPPDGRALDFVRQRQRMVVFGELLYDTDRNKGNVLYTNDWRVIMLDFTRAFRLEEALRRPDTLTTIDRSLLARLRSLTRDDVAKAVGRHLTSGEIDALMKRRQRIVERYDELIVKRGEAAVLY